jgi:adenylate kinase
MDRGEYVPDSLTNALVADRLSHDDCAPGFLLDGYPRTVDQVRALDQVLADQGEKLDAVVELTVETEVVVTRILLRAKDSGRSDDADETVVRSRLELFARETAPLIEVYGGRGLLVQVDAIGEIADVTDRITGALRQRGIG